MKFSEAKPEPNIREMMFDSNFEGMLTTQETKACTSVKQVVAKFLSNVEYANQLLIFTNKINKFKNLVCRINLLSLLAQLSSLFPENFGDVRESIRA